MEKYDPVLRDLAAKEAEDNRAWDFERACEAQEAIVRARLLCSQHGADTTSKPMELAFDAFHDCVNSGRVDGALARAFACLAAGVTPSPYDRAAIEAWADEWIAEVAREQASKLCDE